MFKKLMIVLILPTFIYASYNPFFRKDPTPVKVETPAIEVVIKEVKPVKTNAKIALTIKYFGFVSTYKGEYALVKFGGRSIVVSKNDSLYGSDGVYKIEKIASNYIVIRDYEGRAQKFYFSSGA